jgi:hypothetical protein
MKTPKVALVIVLTIIMLSVPFAASSESHASSMDGTGVIYEGKDIDVESFEKLVGLSKESFMYQYLSKLTVIPVVDESQLVVVELNVDKFFIGEGYIASELENESIHYLLLSARFELEVPLTSDSSLLFSDDVVGNVEELESYLGVNVFVAGDRLVYSGSIDIVNYFSYDESYISVDDSDALICTSDDLIISSIGVTTDITYFHVGSDVGKKFTVDIENNTRCNYFNEYVYESDILTQGLNDCISEHTTNYVDNVTIGLSFDETHRTKEWTHADVKNTYTEESDEVFSVLKDSLRYHESYVITLDSIIGKDLSDTELNEIVNRTGTVISGYQEVFQKASKLISEL